MAEDDESSSSKRTKRRLRSDGETVRQRTEKFQQKQQQNDARKAPGRLSAFGSGFTWPLRRLFQLKFFRILGRILVPGYFRNSWRELRLVSWPDRRTSWRLTYAVIIFSVLFGAVIFVVDLGLDKLFKEFIIK